MSRLLERVRAAARAPRFAPVGVVVLIAALAPLATLAGIATRDAADGDQVAYQAPAGAAAAVKPEPAAAPAAAATAKPVAAPRGEAKGVTGYQMRCWQNGQLLFEENGVALPAGGSPSGARATGTDRYGRPIYLSDTQTATCLMRSATDPRPSR